MALAAVKQIEQLANSIARVK